MSWILTVALATLVIILAAALVRQLYAPDEESSEGRERTKDKTSRGMRSCSFCNRPPQEGSSRLKECTGCRITRYCSEACQTHDWQKHKPFCRYMQDCRKKTYHDTLIIPGDGGAATLRKLPFSLEGANFPNAVFMRAPDMRDIFGSELPEVRYHRIKVENQGEPMDGDYIMWYSISDHLPLNEHLLRNFREREMKPDRQFWHGDVVIAKFIDKQEHRPKEFQSSGGGPEVDFLDMTPEMRPVVNHWMQKFYEVGFKESAKIFDKQK
ncbi:hypothetical protein BKA62DRAFT_690250 [Auriculariales sp. MPI-PUGE-AT-0066]|nr:hypothetical protein BKA62DRAFT_690250 [Auriculariales sp. MPI-PUGE-AT-0066]